jgi:hypothetical protein
MTTDLKARFQEFVKTLDGFEDIDALLKDHDPPGKKRADYLFSERTIIVEQKTLETDPNDKPQKYMDRLMEENRFIGFGTFSTKQVFDKLPDGDKLYKTLIHKFTSVIEGIASNADKQTRDTRDIFGIPNAAGVLVLLNEAAQILTPDLLEYRMQDLFKTDTRDGSVRYPHYDMIIVISELHPVHVGLTKYIPTKRYINSTARQRERAIAFSEKLTAGWAAFNGVPLIRQINVEPIIR